MTKSIVKRSFVLNLVVLRILGLYPFAKHPNLYKIFAFFMYFSFVVPVPILSLLYLLKTEGLDMISISESALLLFEIGCFIFKLWPLIQNAQEVRSTIFLLDQWIFLKYNKKQEIIVDEQINECKRNTLIFTSFCFTSLTLWGIKPLFMTGYVFPIEAYFPFDAKANIRIFSVCYLFIFFGVLFATVSTGVLDPLIAVGLVGHIIAQIKILKDDLMCMGESTEEEISNMQNKNEDCETIRNEIIYRKIGECVDHHNAILHFIKTYEDTFSFLVFTQFAASVLVICYTCFVLVIVEPFTLTFFFSMFFLITMTGEIFLYCYYGTTLYEESDSIITAIYMGTWYTFDMKSKKALLVLMEKAKNPMMITAGKILDLSLVTFTGIIRKAYSLLAVLRNYL